MPIPSRVQIDSPQAASFVHVVHTHIPRTEHTGEEAVTRTIPVGNILLGGNRPVVLIAGPCVIESEGSTLETAARLIDITRALGIPFLFKSSYDKANRSSVR